MPPVSASTWPTRSDARAERTGPDPPVPVRVLYLPTHRAGVAIEQDPIRLRNLLEATERELVGMGWRPGDAEKQLVPARPLLKDRDVWRHQADGLAPFIAPRFFRTSAHRSPSPSWPLCRCSSMSGRAPARRRRRDFPGATELPARMSVDRSARLASMASARSSTVTAPDHRRVPATSRPAQNPPRHPRRARRPAPGHRRRAPTTCHSKARPRRCAGGGGLVLA
jgi:hypothetical protein